jgi:ergothioneine biosynthesis protein EgtB
MALLQVPPGAQPKPDPDTGTLSRFRAVRGHTMALCEAFTAEEMLIQASSDASPTKWHLAHTTWFIDRLVLGPLRPTDPADDFLWNSYYEAVGTRHPRLARGLVTSPTLAQVKEYRRRIDAELEAAVVGGLIDTGAGSMMELALHHEQQHQELILTDILALMRAQPFPRALFGGASSPGQASPHPTASAFRALDGDLFAVGADPRRGFAFDCETPRHLVWLEPFEIAEVLVTNAQWLEFMQAGGYADARLWMSEGWDWVRRESIAAPDGWRTSGDAGWVVVGLGGTAPPEPAAPVSGLSWFEADAFARWAGARLPTEAEWELAALICQPEVPDSSDPLAALARGPGHGFYNALWQWTASPFTPYPGFRPRQDMAEEYNGKFMSGQMVLRGGSFATPPSHVRPTYRNFFPPDRRWQFTGLRLARDAQCSI